LTRVLFNNHASSLRSKLALGRPLANVTEKWWKCF